jgi:hypothetical protein
VTGVRVLPRPDLVVPALATTDQAAVNAALAAHQGRAVAGATARLRRDLPFVAIDRHRRADLLDGPEWGCVATELLRGLDLLRDVDTARSETTALVVDDPYGPAPSPLAGLDDAPATPLAAAAAALGRGGTVRVQDAADLLGALAGLGDDLVGVLSARVSIEAVVAGPGPVDAGLWHDEDRLLVMISGQRDVALTEPSEPWPVPDHSPPPAGRTHTATLGPTDAVWIPRGWGVQHGGRSGATWAELAIRRLRGSDVTERAAFHASADPTLRADAPWDPALIGDDPIGTALTALDADRLAELAVADWTGSLRPVARPALTDLLAATPGPWWCPGGFVAVERVGGLAPVGPDGWVLLAAADRLVVIDPVHLTGLTGDGPLDPEAHRRLLAAGIIVAVRP